MFLLLYLLITIVVIRVGNTSASSVDPEHPHPKGFPDPDPSYSDLSPDTEHNGADTIFNFKSLKCWYTNVDSLSNKLDELKSKISVNKPDIVALSEIYPKSGDFNLNLSIMGYKTIHNIFNPINEEFVLLLTQVLLLIKMII